MSTSSLTAEQLSIPEDFDREELDVLPTAFKLPLRSGAFLTGVYENEKWMKATLRDIESLVELDYDWDGEGATPIDENLYPELCYFLSAYLRPTDDAPRLSPYPDGGIQLEWQKDAKTFFVRIGPDMHYSAAYVDDYSEQEWPDPMPNLESLYEEMTRRLFS